MSFNIGDLIIEEYFEEVWIITAKNVPAPKGPSYENWYWRLDFLYCLNKSRVEPYNNEKVRYCSPKIIEQEFMPISELNTDKT
jgi:hypothetical protein